MKYVYKCDNCQRYSEVKHRVNENPVIVCSECGGGMRRAIQPVGVNWGGLPPHREHEISPLAHDLINNRSANVDAYNAKHNKNVSL